MKIAVIGIGYVGLVAGTVFAEHGHEAVCVDKDPGRIEPLRHSEISIYEPKILVDHEFNYFSIGRPDYRSTRSKRSRRSQICLT